MVALGNDSQDPGMTNMATGCPFEASSQQKRIAAQLLHSPSAEVVFPNGIYTGHPWLDPQLSAPDRLSMEQYTMGAPATNALPLDSISMSIVSMIMTWTTRGTRAYG